MKNNCILTECGDDVCTVESKDVLEMEGSSSGISIKDLASKIDELKLDTLEAVLDNG